MIFSVAALSVLTVPVIARRKKKPGTCRNKLEDAQAHYEATVRFRGLGFRVYTLGKMAF